MEENKGWTDDTVEEEILENAPDEEPGMGVFQKLIGIYIDPVNTLRAIGRKPEFWVPLVVITIAIVAFGAFNLDVSKSAALGDSQMRADLITAQGGEAPDVVVPSSASILIKSLIGSPIGLLIAWVITGGIMALIILIMGGASKFGSLISLMAWVSMPTIFKQAVAAWAIQGQTFTNSWELAKVQGAGTMGLGSFFAGNDFLSMALGQIDIFWLWGVVLMVIALPMFTTLNRQQSITAVVIHSVITLGFGAGMIFFGLQMMERTLAG